MTKKQCPTEWMKLWADLDGVCRQTKPPDLFLLLADDVHGHQHVEGVVHSPTDVLLQRKHALEKQVLNTQVKTLILSEAPLRELVSQADCWRPRAANAAAAGPPEYWLVATSWWPTVARQKVSWTRHCASEGRGIPCQQRLITKKHQLKLFSFLLPCLISIVIDMRDLIILQTSIFVAKYHLPIKLEAGVKAKFISPLSCMKMRKLTNLVNFEILQHWSS